MFQKLDESPDSPRSHFELGEAAHRAGMLQLSVECFSEVTKLAPHVEAGFFNLGNVFFDLKEFQNAMIAYEQAFQRKPDAGTLNNMGNALAGMQDWGNAVLMFDRALAMADCAPEDANIAFRNKGNALIAAGDWENAIENYRKANLRFPSDTGFLGLKARCHRHRYEFGKAMECLVQAIVVSPDHPDLLCQIADLNFMRGRTVESLLCMNQAFSIKPPPHSLHSQRLRMLTYCAPATPERILQEASSWATSQSNQNSISTSTPTVSSSVIDMNQFMNGPVRVGILCGALTSRGLGDWLPHYLIHAGPSMLHWFVYCDQPVDHETRDLLNRAGCRWAETAQLSDSDAASLIKSDQLDLLIDTIGHGHATRLQVISRRPAPVQVAWCAFPMTSGVTQMDFIWSDQVSLPAESEKFFSEEVIRFPQSSHFFMPSCELGLKTDSGELNSPFRCGFLGLPEQISDRMVETMSIVLERIPDAELVFISPAYRDTAFQAEVRARIEKQSHEPSRIRFLSFDSNPAELETYQQLDVCLDSYFVNSPLRAFESLWMGVPVITPADDRLSGRGTASILSSLNKRAWIAYTPSDYIEAVRQLAQNRSIIRSQREKLRSDLLSSCLCNLELLATNVHHAIHETLRRTNSTKKMN
ncbi:MAG: tetratricopeptide repeat protein [Pirellula sp.]